MRYLQPQLHSNSIDGVARTWLWTPPMLSIMEGFAASSWHTKVTGDSFMLINDNKHSLCPKLLLRPIWWYVRSMSRGWGYEAVCLYVCMHSKYSTYLTSEAVRRSLVLVVDIRVLHVAEIVSLPATYKLMGWLRYLSLSLSCIERKTERGG